MVSNLNDDRLAKIRSIQSNCIQTKNRSSSSSTRCPKTGTRMVLVAINTPLINSFNIQIMLRSIYKIIAKECKLSISNRFNLKFEQSEPNIIIPSYQIKIGKLQRFSLENMSYSVAQLGK